MPENTVGTVPGHPGRKAALRVEHCRSGAFESLERALAAAWPNSWPGRFDEVGAWRRSPNTSRDDADRGRGDSIATTFDSGQHVVGGGWISVEASASGTRFNQDRFVVAVLIEARCVC
ncbi:hypothetical protein ACWEKT_38995 [Nocardia takedensis]